MNYNSPMMNLHWTIALAAVLSSPSMAQTIGENTMIVPSAEIHSPASQEKLALIRRFMEVAGIQGRLDSGSFLERYAMLPELGWHESKSVPGKQENLHEFLTGPSEALNAVYEKYRPIYQAEYERHVNWEFTEDELRHMIAFFESALGQHYLDGTWRMQAYTGTNLEEVEQALVVEAVETYRRR